MKSEILDKLKAIKELADTTGIQGNLSLEFTGYTIDEWDAELEQITEYPKYKHFIEISPKLIVSLLLG